MSKPLTVSAYIADASKKARPMLKQIRSAIRAAAPEALEKISYGCRITATKAVSPISQRSETM